MLTTMWDRSHDWPRDAGARTLPQEALPKGRHLQAGDHGPARWPGPWLPGFPLPLSLLQGTVTGGLTRH